MFSTVSCEWYCGLVLITFEVVISYKYPGSWLILFLRFQAEFQVKPDRRNVEECGPILKIRGTK